MIQVFGHCMSQLTEIAPNQGQDDYSHGGRARSNSLAGMIETISITPLAGPPEKDETRGVPFIPWPVHNLIPRVIEPPSPTASLKADTPDVDLLYPEFAWGQSPTTFFRRRPVRSKRLITSIYLQKLRKEAAKAAEAARAAAAGLEDFSEETDENSSLYSLQRRNISARPAPRPTPSRRGAGNQPRRLYQGPKRPVGRPRKGEVKGSRVVVINSPSSSLSPPPPSSSSPPAAPLSVLLNNSSDDDYKPFPKRRRQTNTVPTGSQRNGTDGDGGVAEFVVCVEIPERILRRQHQQSRSTKTATATATSAFDKSSQSKLSPTIRSLSPSLISGIIPTESAQEPLPPSPISLKPDSSLLNFTPALSTSTISLSSPSKITTLSSVSQTPNATSVASIARTKSIETNQCDKLSIIENHGDDDQGPLSWEATGSNPESSFATPATHIPTGMATASTENKQSSILPKALPNPTKEKTFQNWWIQPKKKSGQTLTNRVAVHGIVCAETEVQWHTSGIAERLADDLVVTTSGTVYRIEGSANEHVMQQFGFAPSVIYSFRTGFPENWESILEEHFQSQSSKGASPSSQNEYTPSTIATNPKCANQPSPLDTIRSRNIDLADVEEGHTSRQANDIDMDSTEVVGSHSIPNNNHVELLPAFLSVTPLIESMSPTAATKERSIKEPIISSQLLASSLSPVSTLSNLTCTPSSASSPPPLITAPPKTDILFKSTLCQSSTAPIVSTNTDIDNQEYPVEAQRFSHVLIPYRMRHQERINNRHGSDDNSDAENNNRELQQAQQRHSLAKTPSAINKALLAVSSPSSKPFDQTRDMSPSLVARSQNVLLTLSQQMTIMPDDHSMSPPTSL